MKSSNCRCFSSKHDFLSSSFRAILLYLLIFLIVLSDSSRDEFEVRLSHYSEPQMFDVVRNHSSSNWTFVFPVEKAVCDKLCESRSAFLMHICDNDFVCTANETKNNDNSKNNEECEDNEMCHLCHLSIKCDSLENAERNESRIESNNKDFEEESNNDETVTEKILDNIEESGERKDENVVMLERFDMNVITQEMMDVSKQGNKSFRFSESDRGRVQEDCRCNKSLLHVCAFRTQCTATLLCRDNCSCNLDLVCSGMSNDDNVINNDYVNQEDVDTNDYMKRNFHITLDSARCNNLCRDEKHFIHGICPDTHEQLGSCSTTSRTCRREQCRCDVNIGCHVKHTSTKSSTVIQSSSTTSSLLAPQKLSLSRSSRLGGVFCRDAISKSDCKQMAKAKCEEKRGKVCADDNVCSVLVRDNEKKKCCLKITCLLHNEVKGERLKP